VPRDTQIELETSYGKLLIPLTDIYRIEFRSRPPSADITRRIEAAVADLGHAEFKRRQAASAELMALRERTYPALLKAAQHADPEVAHRAEELLGKLRATVPVEQLELRPRDVVYTEDSTIAGRITAAALKFRTMQSVEQELPLADVRSLAVAERLADALPDPGTMQVFQAQVGKTFTFRVTGALPAALVGAGGFGFAAGGRVWGTHVYTVDSPLALAAVHAGILRPGQTGGVKVTILGPQISFEGSTRNGVTSMPYGPYSGYRIHRVKR
jgi:hypothetical protein